MVSWVEFANSGISGTKNEDDDAGTGNRGKIGETSPSGGKIVFGGAIEIEGRGQEDLARDDQIFVGW